MLSLSKANQFDMTLMFVGEKEKKCIGEIVSKIKKFDQALAKKVEESYTEE